ncbi:uncharacterized protein LOC142237509 [Haematobia irritans]|uniref:uncharacterized protein LOC142237509 n=1 Tax=Haematobia irritans TaxID=7368 RepID=UPI003F503F7E
MKYSYSIIVALLLVASSLAYNPEEFLSSTPVCGSFYDLTKTFPSTLEFSKEFIASGRTWKLVGLGECPPTSECKVYNPVCGMSPANKYQTFMNPCLLEADRKMTGIGWQVVKFGICSTNPADNHPSDSPARVTEPKEANNLDAPLTLASAKAVLKYINALSRSIKEASNNDETQSPMKESPSPSNSQELSTTEMPSTTTMAPMETEAPPSYNNAESSEAKTKLYNHLREMYYATSPLKRIYPRLPIAPRDSQDQSVEMEPKESSLVKRHITAFESDKLEEQEGEDDEEMSTLYKRNAYYPPNPQTGPNPVNFEISLSYPAPPPHSYGYGYDNTAAKVASAVPWAQLGQFVSNLGINYKASGTPCNSTMAPVTNTTNGCVSSTMSACNSTASASNTTTPFQVFIKPCGQTAPFIVHYPEPKYSSYDHHAYPKHPAYNYPTPHHSYGPHSPNPHHGSYNSYPGKSYSSGGYPSYQPHVPSYEHKHSYTYPVSHPKSAFVSAGFY